ncbi:chromosomal replication initiator protein DnaA [Pseudooceanicola nitratireducens]|jgi:chromosomal replication initiator protein|uniref:Chromosomal replication initiator protein DnaA n=1 Tax=Pseudooceanicola nitratireducens TaxID=517719 RepID=A0A1I1H010_9RHOB|nr:chromosomal replication initiator protein DnaA [Pseudooceanicola nitratireducens]MEC7792459.1 chromosomal replication initiator protein DnaA [Pseudomonadota bacterium]MBY6155846.1 chromosomal replication initiator protein DnaA [Pseudooceanicola nitratireducens]MBY6167329.1 chromosomal replication initiator protein DnaA [Pseudooceanicola nitratireducens]MEC9102454.1 chromosomal replication initiator protein DnaA [Pseudomonadota bacterium]MEC9312619.1 chromosomal replication initiator protein|eukprot:g19268.t1
MTKDQWGAVKQNLLANVGQHNYKSWIEPLVLDRTEDGVAVIGAPNSYAGTYVSRNFGDLILGEVSSVNQQIRRLEFIVSQAANVNAAEPARPAQVEVEPAPAPEAAKPAKPSALDAMLQPAPLDPRFTFDSFVVGKPNELAHAAARRVAEGGPVTFNPLFLYGGVGLGKTHLMHAIANELQKNRPELTVVYLSAEQFMYRFVQAIRERRTMDFKSLFRTVDVLMVDDVQFIAGKDSTQEEFFHTFNALVDQNKQIIISGDRAPGEMTDMEERIRSRMQCGLIVDLHPTDYELRLGILQSKVDAQRSQYPDLKMADGVLEFLAHRISTNVRVLEGALTRLFAFSSLVGREITLDLTQECLADILRASERKITVEEIQRKVAEHYNIRMSDLIGPKRVRTYARPRQVAMYLAKQLTSRSLPEIGRRFGGRDHTTVIHGVRRVEELKQQDGQIAEDIELLRRALEA